MDIKVLILMFLVIIVAVSVEGVNNILAAYGCYVLHTARPKSSCKNLVINNQLSIHGLWPLLIVGKSPESCNCSTKFNSNEIKTLISELNAKWTNIEKGSGENFWQHEYEKHGSCASSIEALNTQYKYFDQGLKLFEKYNIKVKFSTIVASM
ncbi:hypothetical protein KQX54_018327 [Cotesia glomerata]|uniref:Uncharacterized protein n=1 Tax=Cotesia glomerata TaxID=32391 RepID=A0AAV7IGP2_COTGL|nr:hypothetical protein KQX54_018327 [Cotesia glomerata]